MTLPETMRTLTAGGLTLDPQVAAHAAELYAVLRDPELHRYTDAEAPASETELAARLVRLESRVSPEGTEHWLNWIVRNKAGELVGYVQATVAGQVAEIAYVFGRAYQRRGYAFAATSAMLRELAAAYGVHRASAKLDPDNTASLALLRKLGFVLFATDEAAHEVSYGRAIP
ncbi:MAG: GNAT family N-acetyltransferase [Devosia sp.]